VDIEQRAVLSGLGDVRVCRSPGGLVKAGPVLHRPRHPEVCVIGDLAPAEQDSIGLPMLAAVGATPGGDGSE